MSKPWVEDTWKTRTGAGSKSANSGKRWRLYWWEDFHQDGALRRRRRSRRFARKVEAEAFASELTLTRYTHPHVQPDGGATAFAEAARQWLDAALDIKASTRNRYERELRTYVLPRWGQVLLKDITRRDIAVWISQLVNGTAVANYRDSDSNEMHGPLSASSVRHITYVLSATLKWAVDNDIIARNPATGVRLPRPDPQEHIYLSHLEVQAIAEAALDVTGRESDRALVYLLAYTGLRINEALALKVKYLDLANGKLEVKHTWSQGRDGKPTLTAPKSSKARRVGVPPFLLESLASTVVELGPEDFVFQAPWGGPASDHNWRTRVFNLCVREAGLEGRGLTPHKLRHTAASMAIAAGADVKLVQQMLGHADATETLNTYSHLWPERIHVVASALEAAREIALRGAAAGPA